jgi:heat shock protein HslJ
MKKISFWIIGLSAFVMLLAACSSAVGGLDGTSWKLESYSAANGDMLEVLPKSVVTLNFQADQVSGSAGCNNYNGSYQTTGRKIDFGPLAATRKMCAQPLGTMEQEAAYLAALDATAEYDLKGNTLEMKDEQGEVILGFVRATGD